MSRRELDPRLNYRIVRTTDGWGKGKLVSDAKDDYLQRTKRRCPRECQLWAVTADTYINERTGGFQVNYPAESVQPVELTEDNPFAGTYLSPHLYEGFYYQKGTEIVPAWEAGPKGVEGAERKRGWLARMVSHDELGAKDTPWEAHETRDAAMQSLIDQFGEKA